jgi:hypothetical protein
VVYSEDFEDNARMAVELALGSAHPYAEDEVAELWDLLVDFATRVSNESQHPLSPSQLCAIAAHIARNEPLVDFLVVQSVESRLAEGRYDRPAWVAGGPLQLAVRGVKEGLAALLAARAAHDAWPEGTNPGQVDHA